ncbi:septum formation protein [Desulfuromusa kysingii]|uniref:7-methyl-GTP pyrophosphatase n=1 Tax=Desulfuromusa kysingii TaxID=37625 RepID=A0A1H3Y5A5_9BACT|nr:nucleoside triphosphate pyrophosphatase [Desulfuromusa kysingii]SEA06819.1 septum formation protein [Desulfuromusa kysingii]
MRTIILASTSPYRQQLLQQLDLPFIAVAPTFIEEIDPNVAPALLVRHLALGKAQSLAETYPDALIIGADQVFVDQRRRPLGKPGNLQAAFQQLKQMVGRTHSFYTGLTLLDSRSGVVQVDYATYSVTFRQLSDDQIFNYLQREKPFDCAGSFKIEGLGIALMEKMSGEDYNSLIGLPLIKLVSMLAVAGVNILES